MVGHPVWTRRGGLGYAGTRTCRICTNRFTNPCTTTIKSFPKNNTTKQNKTKQNSSESKAKLDDFINRPNKEKNVSKENIESEHTTSTNTNTKANTAQKKNHARSRTRAIKSQAYRPQAYKPQAFSEPLTKPQAYKPHAYSEPLVCEGAHKHKDEHKSKYCTNQATGVFGAPYKATGV